MPAAVEMIGGERRAAAAARHQHDLVAEQSIERRIRQQRDGLDELIVAVGLHDAAAAQESRHGSSVSPASAPVCERIIAWPVAERPIWTNTSDFLLRMRRGRHADKLARIFQLLDDGGDHLDVGIGDEILDIVLDRCADLIAA